jgi:acyl-coenzyme A synthetase/AMP-(fatty) acid ligase
VTSLPRLFVDPRAADAIVARRADQTLSFARFRTDVAVTATRLHRARCRRGALICRDSYLFLVGLFALMAAGAEAAIPPNSLASTLSALSGAWDTLITDDPSLPGANVILPVSSEAEALPSTPLDGQLAVFTSGSTGAPKRVVRRLQDLDREIAELERLWGPVAESATVYTTVPHQHIYGLTFARLWPLAAGRPFAAEIFEVWEPLLAALSSTSVVISSPAHLIRLGGLAPLPPDRRPRMLFSAGAPLSFRAAQDAASILGPLPTEIYGSTETGAIATRTQREDRTPWRPLPGVAVRRHSDSRLELSSPWVEDGKWLTTEDGVEPADGQSAFHLTGRVDRVVKIEGKRIALQEVEQRLAGLRWVAEAAAVALPGESEILAAAVVLTPDGHDELQRLGAFRFARLLRRELAVFHDAAALPRRWRFVTQLPSGAMGKRSAAAVSALFQDRP